MRKAICLKGVEKSENVCYNELYVERSYMSDILKENKKYYIALDSDVLRFILSMKYHNPDSDKKRDDEPWFVERFGKTMNDLIDAVEHDVIRLVGTRTLVGECPTTNKDRKELYQKYLYFPDFESEKYQKANQFISLLADKYSSTGGKHTILGKIYSPTLRKSVPCNDAFITAEASTELVHLLTNNCRDLIYDRSYATRMAQQLGITTEEYIKSRDFGFYTQKRLRGMNCACGVLEECNGHQRVPYPICLMELAEMFEKGQLGKLLIKREYPDLKRYEDLSKETQAVIDYNPRGIEDF